MRLWLLIHHPGRSAFDVETLGFVAGGTMPEFAIIVPAACLKSRL
jgi:hypothetical protein